MHVFYGTSIRGLTVPESFVHGPYRIREKTACLYELGGP